MVATLFLISSAAPGSSGVSHPRAPESDSLMLACYPSATPLFLFSLCLSSSLSLINVKPSNNKASILSLAAFSALHVCHCALDPPPPPPPAQAATVILSHGRGAGTPGPHRQHERFTGSLSRGGVQEGKNEEEAFPPLQSFFFSFGHREEKKNPFIIYIIHGTHRKKTGL